MKWLNMNERVRVTTCGKCQLRCRRGRQTRRGVWCACGGQLLLHKRGERERGGEHQLGYLSHCSSAVASCFFFLFHFCPSASGVAGGMKLFILAFFFLHVAFVTAGLFRRTDGKTSQNSLTGGRVQLPQNGGERGEQRGSSPSLSAVCLCAFGCACACARTDG